MARGDGLLGLPGLIGRLVDDLRNLARAEIHLVKARGFDLVRRSRTAIALLICALLLVHGAVVALMIGLVLQLLPIVGAAFAGLIVMAAALVLAGILAYAALRAFSGKATKADAAKSDVVESAVETST